MKEIDLFEALKENYIPDLVKNDNEFGTFDCSSEKYKTHIELKCRKWHYEQQIIEKDKYDRLCDFPGKVKYIVSDPTGVFSYDIKNIPEPTWEDRSMPKTSEFDCKDFVMKKVGYWNYNYQGKLIDL